MRGLRCRDVGCCVAGGLDGSAGLSVFAVGSRPAFMAAERSGCAARVRLGWKLVVSTWNWWQPSRARKPAKVDSAAITWTWLWALASRAWWAIAEANLDHEVAFEPGRWARRRPEPDWLGSTSRSRHW